MPTDDATIADGQGTRYSCRNLDEIDAHLAGLHTWYQRQLAAAHHAPPGRRGECRARILEKYRYDLDVLLDRRLYLQVTGE